MLIIKNIEQGENSFRAFKETISKELMRKFFFVAKNKHKFQSLQISI